VALAQNIGDDEMTKPVELEEGDKVRMLERETGMGDPPKGEIGTFIRSNPDNDQFLIRWDLWYYGHGPGNQEWWMHRHQLRKFPKRVEQ